MSKELEIEQLQSDIASLGRIQDVMQNEIQRAQDELCCVTHKSKHFELEVVAGIFSWWLDDTGSHNRAAHMSVISSKEA